MEIADGRPPNVRKRPAETAKRHHSTVWGARRAVMQKGRKTGGKCAARLDNGGGSTYNSLVSVQRGVLRPFADGDPIISGGESPRTKRREAP